MQEDNITGVQNASTSNHARSSYAILVPPLFCTIMAVGFIGNTLLVYTVLRWRDMKTPCNYLILNNAIADLGVALVAAPLRIVDFYYGWILGETACQVLAPTQDVFVVVSVITYTIIAFERYRAVMTPFKRHFSLKTIGIVAVFIWITAYLCTGLPIAMILSVQMIQGKPLCTTTFASKTALRLYEIYLVLVFLLVPLFLQTLAYSILVHHLTGRNSKDKSLENSTSSRGRRIKKRRLVRVTIILIAFFQICYIPRMVMMIIYDFAREITNNNYFVYVDLSVMALFYVKHVINPIILFTISTEFRRHSPWRTTTCFHVIPRRFRVFSSRRSTMSTRLSFLDNKDNEREAINKETEF